MKAASTTRAHKKPRIGMSDPLRQASIRGLAGLLPSLGEGLVLTGILVAALGGYAFGVAFGLLVLSAIALLLAILAIWTSVQVLVEDQPESEVELLTLLMERAEDAQKLALLRALKELESERDQGKIGQEDYEQLRRIYRDQAKNVLKAADGVPQDARCRAEEAVRNYLKSKEISVVDAAGGGASQEATSCAPDEQVSPRATAAIACSKQCPSCNAGNDEDAVYCKKCGSALASSAHAQESNTR